MELLDSVADHACRCLARYDSQVGERGLLAAVSGGIDSTALLLVLVHLLARRRIRGPLHLAHVDHGVRADSSAAADHVRTLAERFGLPFVHRRLELGRRPSESAMREARYLALADLSREAGARIVLTAHHADDNIETVLFRMMRGTGIRGLAGIPESRRLDRQLLVVRPLLGIRRSALEDLVTERGLGVVEDVTNLDLGYARNRLRHSTIPTLRHAVGPGLDSTLMAVSRSARAAADLLEAHGARLLQGRGERVTPWRLELSLAGLERIPRAFVEELLRQAHRVLDPRGRAPLGLWCARAAGLLDKPAGRRLQGRSGLLVERLRHGLLILDPSCAGRPPEHPQPFEPDAGRHRFGATEWWLEGFVHPEPPLVPSPREMGPRRALLDPRRSPLPWRLRRRRPGDRFQPLGAPTSVDLRRFLQRRHLPRFDRERLPLVVDATGRILWVPGVEVAEHAALQLNTRACVELQAGCA